MTLKNKAALLWAVLISVPMGGAAFFMDIPVAAAGLIAVLGGLGAALAVFVFWESAPRALRRRSEAR